MKKCQNLENVSKSGKMCPNLGKWGQVRPSEAKGGPETAKGGPVVSKRAQWCPRGPSGVPVENQWGNSAEESPGPIPRGSTRDRTMSRYHYHRVPHPPRRPLGTPSPATPTARTRFTRLLCVTVNTQQWRYPRLPLFWCPSGVPVVPEQKCQNGPEKRANFSKTDKTEKFSVFSEIQCFLGFFRVYSQC